MRGVIPSDTVVESTAATTGEETWVFRWYEFASNTCFSFLGEDACMNGETAASLPPGPPEPEPEPGPILSTPFNPVPELGLNPPFVMDLALPGELRILNGLTGLGSIIGPEYAFFFGVVKRVRAVELLASADGAGGGGGESFACDALRLSDWACDDLPLALDSA